MSQLKKNIENHIRHFFVSSCIELGFGLLLVDYLGIKYLYSEFGILAYIKKNDNGYNLVIDGNAISHIGFIKNIDRFVCKSIKETDFKIKDDTTEFDSLTELLLYYSDLIYSNLRDNYETYIDTTIDNLHNDNVYIDIVTYIE